MPLLIKNIEGEVFENTFDNVSYITNINSVVQQEDYINLNGIIAYLQNLSQAQDTYLLTKPLNFGLKNSFNLKIQTLEINY